MRPSAPVVALPVFEAKDVEFGYGGTFRLDRASFEVAEGEIMGLVGPNSSGKTTLLRLLSKVRAPDRGEIRYRGQPLGAVGRLALARDVAVVPQEEQLAFSVSVEELVLMGRFPRSEGRLFEGPADLAQAREAMALAGVLELGDHPEIGRDRKSTRLNSSHLKLSRMPSSA